MARKLGNASTDRVTVTAAPAINDIPKNSGAMTAIVTGMRTTDTNNQQLVTKYTDAFGQTSGFQFYMHDNGAAHGCLAGGPSGTSSGAYAANASAADATVLNQNEIWAMTWAGQTFAPKLFRNAIDTPIAEVGAYSAGNIATGPSGADAGADLLIGNKNTFALPYEGYMGWVILYGPELSLAQIRRVQYGVLVHRQGWLESDNAKITRGVNIMKSIAGYLVLLYMAQDGSFNEYSGNGFTIVATGTSLPADNEVANFDCPTTFDGDAEIYNTTGAYTREQYDYVVTSGQVRAKYVTAATAGRVWLWSPAVATPPKLDIEFYVGAPTSGAPTGGIANTVAGYNSGAFSGLAGTSKSITFQTPSRNPPASAGQLPGVVALQVVFFNASYTRTAAVPLASQNSILAFCDSIGDGNVGFPTQQYGYLQQVRNALPAWAAELGMWSYSGMQLRDIALNSTLIAQYVAMIVAINPKAVYIAEGFNDRGLNTVGWTAAVFQAQLAAFIAAARLAGYLGHFYLADPIIAGTFYEGANVNGDTLDAFRTAIANAASGRNAVEYVSLKAVLVTSDLSEASPNEIHPPAAGQNKLYTNKIAGVFAGAPAMLTVVAAIAVASWVVPQVTVIAPQTVTPAVATRTWSVATPTLSQSWVPGTFKNVKTGSSNGAAIVLASLGPAAVGDLVYVANGGSGAGNATNVPSDSVTSGYTKIAARNDGSSGGAAAYWARVTAATANLVVSFTPDSGAATIVASLVAGPFTYDADQANVADFSGTSTAFSDGPTTLPIPPNSLALSVAGAAASEPSTPDPTGYNTVGASNNFTAAMRTAFHQETASGAAAVCLVSYKVTSAPATAAMTLPVAANWFGVIATFSFSQIPTPATTIWVVATPNLPLSFAPTPATSTWTIVAPTVSTAVAPALAIRTWSVATPTPTLGPIAPSMSTAVAAWTAVPPTIAVGPIAPLLSLTTSAWVVPAPTITVGAIAPAAGVGARVWTVLTPTLTLGGTIFPAPAIRTWTVVGVAPALAVSPPLLPAVTTWAAQATVTGTAVGPAVTSPTRLSITNRGNTVQLAASRTSLTLD